MAKKIIIGKRPYIKVRYIKLFIKDLDPIILYLKIDIRINNILLKKIIFINQKMKLIILLN